MILICVCYFLLEVASFRYLHFEIKCIFNLMFVIVGKSHDLVAKVRKFNLSLGNLSSMCFCG